MTSFVMCHDNSGQEGVRPRSSSDACRAGGQTDIKAKGRAINNFPVFLGGTSRRSVMATMRRRKLFIGRP